MRKPPAEAVKELAHVLRLDHNGHEIPDPTPVAIPAGFRRPETLAEQVQRLVRTGLSQLSSEAGAETFEESEDFDIDDDFDPSSPYETFFDPVLGKDITPMEFQANEAHYRNQYVAAQKQYFDNIDREGVLAENLFRAKVKREKPGGDGGAPPSPSSEGPTGPLAKQS